MYPSSVNSHFNVMLRFITRRLRMSSVPKFSSSRKQPWLQSPYRIRHSDSDLSGEESRYYGAGLQITTQLRSNGILHSLALVQDDGFDRGW